MFVMKSAETDEILGITNVTMVIWIVLMDVMEIVMWKLVGSVLEVILEELSQLLTFVQRFVEMGSTEDGIHVMMEIFKTEMVAQKIVFKSLVFDVLEEMWET